MSAGRYINGITVLTLITYTTKAANANNVHQLRRSPAAGVGAREPAPAAASPNK